MKNTAPNTAFEIQDYELNLKKDQYVPTGKTYEEKEFDIIIKIKNGDKNTYKTLTGNYFTDVVVNNRIYESNKNKII
jgi:hypothetical protein